MQTAKSIFLNWLVATFTACAVAVPTIVHAEKLAASAASARLGNERPCIRYDFGRAVNTCLNDVLVNLTARTQITGSRSIFGAGDGGTRCQAVRLNQDGLMTATTGYKSLAVSQFDIFTSMGPLNVASGETVIFECVLKANQVGWLGAVMY
jgi:hypothetical protein